MKQQAIRNSDIMSEFDKHARYKFMWGMLAGIGLAGATLFAALFIAVLLYR